MPPGRTRKALKKNAGAEEPEPVSEQTSTENIAALDNSGVIEQAQDTTESSENSTFKTEQEEEISQQSNQEISNSTPKVKTEIENQNVPQPSSEPDQENPSKSSSTVVPDKKESNSEKPDNSQQSSTLDNKNKTEKSEKTESTLQGDNVESDSQATTTEESEVTDSKVALEKQDDDAVPSQYPITTAIYIWNLSRPLVIRELQRFISSCSGGEEPKRVWFDRIRTHCFVEFQTKKASQIAREAIHLARFPAQDLQRPPMMADYVPPDMLDKWIEMEEQEGTRSLKRWVVKYTEDPNSEIDSIAELIIDPNSVQKGKTTKAGSREEGGISKVSERNGGGSINGYDKDVEMRSGSQSPRNQRSRLRNRSYSPTPSPERSGPRSPRSRSPTHSPSNSRPRSHSLPHSRSPSRSRSYSRSPSRSRSRSFSRSRSRSRSPSRSRSRSLSRSRSPQRFNRGGSSRENVQYTKVRPSRPFSEAPEEIVAERLRKSGVGALGKKAFQRNLSFNTSQRKRGGGGRRRN